MGRLWMGLIALALVACGSEDDEAPLPVVRTTVTFVYSASTFPDAGVAEDHAECVRIVGPTHIHPSWQGFPVVPFRNERRFWERTFDDVPVDTLLRVRVSDGNRCNRDPCGATTEDLTANDVSLTTPATTPGGCRPGQTTEPGLSFTVAEDGTITP